MSLINDRLIYLSLDEKIRYLHPFLEIEEDEKDEDEEVKE